MIARIAGISVVSLMLLGLAAVVSSAQALATDQGATLLASGPAAQDCWNADESGPTSVDLKNRHRYQRQHQYRHQYRKGDGQAAGSEEIGTRLRQRDQQRDRQRDRQRDQERSRDGSCQ